MKKTLMTFVAVGFGVSVAFAQVTGTPQEGEQQDTDLQNTEYNQQDQQTQNEYAQDEEGKRRVEMSELPLEVQQAFRESEYNNLEVLAIYEMKDEQSTEEIGTAGTDTEMGQQDQGVTYAFELAETGQGEQGAMGQEGTTDDGMGGVETERVSERQPDKIVHFNEAGEVVKEKDADEMKDKHGTDY
jgi:hypothetical protein